MKESLEDAIKGIRADGTLLSLDEAGIRARVIDHILDRLGWRIFDQNEFKREYSVSGGAVDYALRINGEPKAFIEAKRPSEHLDGHQDQLFRYSGIRGVPLAVLTNGFNWWIYLPLKEGDAESRRFCELDIANQDVSETCDRLIKFLARDNVDSGAAVKDAEAQLKRLEDAKKIDHALPRAWKELTDGPDDLLIDLINDRVRELCSVEAAPARIKEFLEGLGKPARVAKQPVKKNETTNTRRIARITSCSLGLSKLDNVADEDLLHAMLSDIVANYTDAKSINERSIRANVREYMTSRGFIEFYMLAEWGGIKSDRKRFCKIDICNAKHAENRRR